MDRTDLRLEPNEASDLSPAFDDDVLRRRGWDRAFVTVLDEAPAEEAIAVLVHQAGAPPAADWRAIRIAGAPTRAKAQTQDAEACARRDGWLYLLGSQFGDKEGPLDPRRSWIARVREEALADGLDGAPAEVDVVPLRFALHRAVNDALREAQVALWPLGDRSRAAYIDATIARGAAKDKRWAGMVTSADTPINVEALEFRGDGRALLGLRYPVTADGAPLLVEVEDLEAVFGDDDAVPGCSRVWTLEGIASAERPMGTRALAAQGPDRFHAVLGNLDAAGKGATILADHPNAGDATSLHVRFELPLTAGGGSVLATPVHDFGDLQRVEGVAFDSDGRAHYVVDDDGRVELQTLVVED